MFQFGFRFDLSTNHIVTILYPNIKRLLPLANTANIAADIWDNREIITV